MACLYCNFANPDNASRCNSCGRSLTLAVYRPAGKKSIAPLVFFGLAIAYALSPIDLVPDVIPFVGWAEDILFLVATGLNALQHGVSETNQTLAAILKTLKWGVIILGVIAVSVILIFGAIIIELLKSIFGG